MLLAMAHAQTAFGASPVDAASEVWLTGGSQVRMWLKALARTHTSHSKPARAFAALQISVASPSPRSRILQVRRAGLPGLGFG